MNLESNKTDLAVTLAKSALSALPIAGPLIAELVGEVIPNQRVDRLVKYVEELGERLSKIPVEKINKLFDKPEFVDLVEEGFVQAARAISDDRRAYIASIVSNGITDESIELAASKYLLKVLEEINDVEVIYLRSYYYSSGEEDQKFRSKHENVLNPIDYFGGSDEETIEYKSAIRESYKGHLERLGLIEKVLRFDKSSGLPEYNKQTKKPKIASTKVTLLGKLLLNQIDLINK